MRRLVGRETRFTHMSVAIAEFIGIHTALVWGDFGIEIKLFVAPVALVSRTISAPPPLFNRNSVNEPT